MKKFIFSIILMLSVFMTSFAQQTTVEGSKIFDNTTVSVYTGAMGWVNPSVVNADNFIQGVRPNVGVALGKWFTPVVGVEMFYEASANSLPFNTTDKRWTAFDMSNLGFNAQVNLNNLFAHYKGQPNLVEVVPYAGLGLVHGFTKDPGCNLYVPYAGDNTTNFMTANTGVRIDFNLGKQRAWQISYRSGISYMLAGEGLPVQLNSQRAYVTSQVAFTYKFGHKNSTGTKTHNFTKAYTVAEYAALQSQFADLQKAYDQKPKEVEVERWIEKVVEKEVPVEVEKSVAANTNPRFVQGLAIVDATSLAFLDSLADEMKSNDSNYLITGYASLEGSEAVNNALSLRRAIAIKNCLIDRGVDANRLTTVGAGATDKFGPSYEVNRRVVVEKQ